jgi:hypothetical protein
MEMETEHSNNYKDQFTEDERRIIELSLFWFIRIILGETKPDIEPKQKHEVMKIYFPIPQVIDFYLANQHGDLFAQQVIRAIREDFGKLWEIALCLGSNRREPLNDIAEMMSLIERNPTIDSKAFKIIIITLTIGIFKGLGISIARKDNFKKNLIFLLNTLGIPEKDWPKY